MTCEHCGADAVDAGGVCQVCGWRAGSGSAPRHEMRHASGASLAETREADIPLPARRVTGAARHDASAAPPGWQPPPIAQAPRSGPRGGGSGVFGGAAPASARFCGTCGAEIEPGHQFCGQCGTPVAEFEAPGNRPTLARRGTLPPAPYDDDTGPWSPADQDAPTEQFGPPFGYHNTPYRQSGYGAAPDTPAGLSREARVFLGILCLLGALISGAGAIVLAFVR